MVNNYYIILPSFFKKFVAVDINNISCVKAAVDILFNAAFSFVSSMVSN